VAPLVKTQLHERGSYICFDPNIWDTVHKVTYLKYNMKIFVALFSSGEM
jgi:hypothetical protein